MKAIAITLCVRLALCGAVAWLGWRMSGPAGLLAGGVLLALVLPRPLLDLAGELRHALRARVWREAMGHYFVYRGHRIRVLEDVSHQRWVCVADVRAVVGSSVSDGALALTYPNGLLHQGDPALAYLSDDALLIHLARDPGPRANRFRHWAEREIAFPARQRRARLGIRLQGPEMPSRE
jgi:hypothetical protein